MNSSTGTRGVWKVFTFAVSSAQPMRHAAHQHFIRAGADVRQDDLFKAVPGGLRAGVQATGARRNHDALHEHAVVDQRTASHHPVQREHEAHRRIEEAEVPVVLGMHLVLVALGDAQEAVQAPAVLAPAVQVGRDPFLRVVVVFLLVLGRQGRVGIDRVVRGADLFHQAVAARALQHIDLPGLGVGAGRARAARLAGCR